MPAERSKTKGRKTNMSSEFVTQIRVRRERLLKTLTELSRIGRDPTGGITRTTFCEADLQARKYVIDLMHDAGLQVKMDQFANIIGIMKGPPRSPVVICGSHIDTVPNGGALDGAYGVLAGIEVIQRIMEDISTRNGIEVVAFTEEEGARFPAFMGSLGFTGLLPKPVAYSLKDRDGISFEEALAGVGLDCASQSPAHLSNEEFKAYVELHIEQGPILERESIPIGVVESIVGVGELAVEIEGCCGHSGTVPVALRRDALVGAAQIVLGVNHIMCVRASSLATVGQIDILPNASNAIPSKVTIGIDFRDSTLSGLESLQGEIVSVCERVAKENNLSVTVKTRTYANPARMSATVIDAIISSAQEMNLEDKTMHSGAAHDCQNMAAVTDAGMIFVPCRGGFSHSPDESAYPENLEAGANVLLGTVLRLANQC